MLTADGHEPLVTQVFAEGGPSIDSDALFGVEDSLVRAYVPKVPGTAPDCRAVDRPWRHRVHEFGLRRIA